MHELNAIQTRQIQSFKLTSSFDDLQCQTLLLFLQQIYFLDGQDKQLLRKRRLIDCFQNLVCLLAHEVLTNHVAHAEVWAVRQDVPKCLEDVIIRNLAWVNSGHFFNGLSTLRLDQSLQ